MSQISPPIRILLVAVIGLIAVYMLFLRPKTEEAVPAAAAPAATTPVPAKDPGAATSTGSGAVVQDAVKRTTDASAQSKVAAGETPGGLAADEATPTTGVAAAAPAAGSSAAEPAPVTKETLRSLPRDVRPAVRKHKVIVMLFYNNRSSDDRAVRRALDKVDHYGGQVFVDAHWIKSVSRYQAIARGVDVEQSPTIVVADRNLKAEALVGYVDDETIDQAVVDALVASGGSLLRNPYFRKVDSVCNSAKAEIKEIPAPAGAAAIPAYLDGVQNVAASMKTRAAAIKPGKSHRTFHKAFVGYAADSVGVVAAGQLYLKSNPAKGTAAVKRTVKRGNALDKRFTKKHGAHGLSCF